MKDYRKELDRIEGIKKNKMQRMDFILIAGKAIGSGLLDRLGDKCYIGRGEQERSGNFRECLLNRGHPQLF